jgi:hypothetical protein
VGAKRIPDAGIPNKDGRTLWVNKENIVTTDK